MMTIFLNDMSRLAEYFATILEGLVRILKNALAQFKLSFGPATRFHPISGG